MHETIVIYNCGHIRVLFSDDKLQVRKNSSPNIVYEGVIIALKEKDLILVQFRDDFVKTFDYSDYSVKFLTNRQTFIREHFALDLAIDIYGLDFLLPKEKSVREKPLSEVELNGDMEMKCEKTGKLVEWINPKLNEYQKQTVSNALRADFLNPFLIFGPPGNFFSFLLIESKSSCRCKSYLYKALNLSYACHQRNRKDDHTL